ncbi:putative leucine-rich repeat domain superfamily [Helianthus annuus]|uniref:Leucine-rich repeat domain superfamily n=1 Tax=Helianthus annuus TaxID=4232 RepID=A0A9K3GVH2_HELAN|nr:putative leucine-rich repeat domain superfamily [Helianthus annuus]KAJ0429316.1 putative leucine-rich repeat domain superfamily [Helianthus annuus]KAJ0636499.1 putative leucine-rich repeat domain superfamily [Helianthus annuus]
MPFENLQTISSAVLGHEPTSWVNYFPGVKKLSCSVYGDRRYDLKSLTFLEILKIIGMKSKVIPRFKKKSMIRFPASLTKLTLKGCHLPWSHMSYIQSLPNLEVLKLLTDAFVGPQWDAGEEPFQQLKFLKLSCLDIQQWEASSISFPCLKQLVLFCCFSLERIPFDMTYIPTLEDIQIEGCSNSVIVSAYDIQEEQQADGNYDLKIRVKRSRSSSLIRWLRAPGSSTKLYKLIYDIYESMMRVRTGISINLLTPHELQTLGLPINRPPAHHHIRRGRIRNDDRSKYHPIKPKILKGVRY